MKVSVFVLCLQIAVLFSNGFTRSSVASDAVRFQVNNDQLQSLAWRGHEFINQNADQYQARLVTSTGDLEQPGYQYTVTKGNTITRVYTWGTMAVTWRSENNILHASLQATNRQSSSLNGVQWIFGNVRFPNTPQGWSTTDQYGWDSRSSVPYLEIKWGDAQNYVVLASDNVSAPLGVYLGSGDNSGGYPLVATLSQSIPSNGTATAAFSLRFRSASTPVSVTDVKRSYVSKYPFLLGDATDRRAIGVYIACKVQTGSRTNPRGWFNGDSGIDVTTSQGRAQFKSAMLDSARYQVKSITGINGQGFIMWDPEGEEFEEGTSTFIGDPRLTSRLAPEFDAIADEFFQIFRSAGLKTGLCLRANSIHFRGNQPIQAYYKTRAEAFLNLAGKVDYARKRWGCTLFYVDSFGGSDAYNLELFRDLDKKYPGTLFLPELNEVVEEAHAVTAPYYATRFPYNLGETPQSVRDIYPSAFAGIYIADTDFNQYGNLILDGINKGDIYLYRSWLGMDDGDYPRLKSLYQKAGKLAQ